MFNPYLDKHTHFRVSTRPDYINSDILLFLKSNKVKTIELGVQSFCDAELKGAKRGYSATVAINACNLVRKYEFDLAVQLMIGLLGTTPKSVEINISNLINLSPNYLRIYPVVVLKNTLLEKLYLEGNYTPLTFEEAIQDSIKLYTVCKNQNIKVIKIGVHSDITKSEIVAGPYHERFGEIVRNMFDRNLES
jgi:histone acetyltransferase (RNA polymerase elongator complex component)